MHLLSLLGPLFHRATITIVSEWPNDKETELILSFYDCTLSQLAPSRQYKHYRLDNLMTFDVRMCVCDCEYQNIVNELWAWVPRRLKLTHIIIMITAAVAIVIAADIERKQFFRVFISLLLLLPPSPSPSLPSLPLLSIITMNHTRCAHRLCSSNHYVYARPSISLAKPERYYMPM